MDIISFYAAVVTFRIAVPRLTGCYSYKVQGDLERKAISEIISFCYTVLLFMSLVQRIHCSMRPRSSCMPFSLGAILCIAQTEKVTHRMLLYLRVCC